MRIRKNKKLSSFPGQTVHICRLNQSTWDADPLPDEAYTFDYEDSFNGNGSIGDSIGVVESVATMVGSKEEAITKVGGTVIEDDDDDNNDGIQIAGRFEESDREVLLKSCNNNNNKSDGGRAEDYDNRLTGSRRGRGRATRKKGSSSALISNEFWYYSGFRPSRGRRRGVGDNASGFSYDLMAENNNGSVVTVQNNLTVACYSQSDNDEEFDYVYDEEEEEDNRRKRMRKPIKERSLKSLM